MDSIFIRYRKVAWLKNITESGASFARSEPEKRNIVLTNGLSMVTALAVIALLVFHRIFTAPEPSARSWLYLGFVLFLIPIFLNRQGFTNAARFAVCWLPPLFLMLVSYNVFLKEAPITVGSYVGMRYYLLAFCCPPFLVFEIPRERKFIFALACPVALLLLFDPIFSALGIGYENATAADYAFNNVRALVAMSIICLASYLLKSRADRNEELNKRLISELALKNEEVQKQASDSVHKLNDELYMRLQQLSERELILNQSQRIARVGSWEYTIKDNSIFWSDEMYNIFGVDRSFKIRPDNLSDIVGGEAGQQVSAAIGNLLKNGEPFDITFKIRMPLGYMKWLRMYAFPVRGADAMTGVRGICHDITNFKEAEEMLKASDMKYRLLFEQASDAIIITDFRGNFLDANSGFCKMFGYTISELLRMNIVDLLDQDEAVRRPIMFGALQEGVHILNDRRMIGKDGTQREVEANVKKIDTQRVMAIIRDVTDLRFAQKQIQISEAKFRGAFEYSAIGMSLVSLDGYWLQVNREFCAMLGYTETELIGMHFRDITHFDDIEENMNLFKQASRGEREMYRKEKRYIHKKGNIIWVRLSVSVIKDDRGTPVYCVAQIEDVTQEKLATQQLMSSQANLRATINTTNILIWSLDTNYRLLTFNDTFAAYIKDLNGVEMRVGQNLFTEVFPNDKQRDLIARWRSWYDRALAGESFTLEDEGHLNTVFQYSLSPIREGDKVVGAAIFAEDITRRKQHDAELAEANKKIEELKLMALRSVMSPHFIFNVLNSIQFFIARNDRLNAINYLSTFSKLIRSILNHSVTNRIKLVEEVELLKNYVHLEMTRFEEKFSFEMDVASGLDMESVEIPSLLIQPYVENAILHGLYNKKTPGVLKIRVKEGKQSVVFQIEDNGVGRAEAMRVRRETFPAHKSVGIRLTEERLKLIKQQNNAAFEVEDLFDNDGPSGTRVTISIPY